MMASKVVMFRDTVRPQNGLPVVSRKIELPVSCQFLRPSVDSHIEILPSIESPSTVITKGRPVAANFARCRGLASTSRKDADGHTRLASSVQ